MPREYSVSFEKVSITAVQDLVTILGATGKMCRVKRCTIIDVESTAPTNEQLALRFRILPATVSAGSGGSMPTPRPFDPGDAAATFTAHANDTSKTTTSGTAEIVEEGGCNVFGGYDYFFPYPPLIGPTSAGVFELITAPSVTIICSGTVVVEEMG